MTAQSTTDWLGQSVTLSGAADAACKAALDDFVAGFLGCQARVVNILPVTKAEPAAIVHAYAAMLHMFAETSSAASNARPFIVRARAAAGDATAREQSVVRLIHAWVEADVAQMLALHDEHARRWPRDLPMIKLGQYHRFNLGQFDAMHSLGQLGLAAAPDVAYAYGMAAFGLEQVHRLDEAESTARRGVEIERAEPWAHHALAHVMLTQERLDEGRRFMDSVADTWVGLNSFMVTHNWWHQALFCIHQGDGAAALALYDTRVWGVEKSYSQDQIGAVSLLARLELAGVDVGQRWQELVPWLSQRVDDRVQPFLDLQYLYGLARAGSAARETQAMLRSIESHAAMQCGPAAAAWQQVAVPAAHALVAYAAGAHAIAYGRLQPLLSRLHEIGGSHAQRDLFVRVAADAARRSDAG